MEMKSIFVELSRFSMVSISFHPPPKTTGTSTENNDADAQSFPIDITYIVIGAAGLVAVIVAVVIAGIIFCVISNELKNKALREHKHACAVKLEELRTKADLLRQEQAKNEKPKEMKSIPIKDPAVEIAKYKYLLDSGAITQEEYDAKKKQFLEM